MQRQTPPDFPVRRPALSIEIRLKMGSHKIELQIRDNGKGMPKGELERDGAQGYVPKARSIPSCFRPSELYPPVKFT